MRTVLWAKFPANREIYREIYEFGPRLPTVVLPIRLKMGQFLSLSLAKDNLPNRELSPTYQGITVP